MTGDLRLDWPPAQGRMTALLDGINDHPLHDADGGL
jgi:hypothetical protein